MLPLILVYMATSVTMHTNISGNISKHVSRNFQDAHQNKLFAWESWVMMEMMAGDLSTDVDMYIHIHGNKTHATNA